MNRGFSFTFRNPPSTLTGEFLNDLRNIRTIGPLVWLYHPHFSRPEALQALPSEKQDLVRDFAAICQRFGYLVLLSQNLEIALRDCLLDIELYYLARCGERPFPKSPSQAKFNELIDFFVQQLVLSDPGSVDLKRRFHRARRLCNDYIHHFFDLENMGTDEPGDRKRLLDRLSEAEQLFHPLLLLVCLINQAYCDELGMTELMQVELERIRKEREHRRRVADDLLKEIDMEALFE